MLTPPGVCHSITAAIADAWRDEMRRAETQESFDSWLRVVSPTWHWDWRHLVYVRQALDRVTSGELRRLMVFMPPRHGKSEQNTVRYAAWRIERDPSLRVIIGAYNQTLANKFARKARRIASARMTLATDRTAVNDWETPEGGGMRAVGVGAGITGHGGDLLLVDDPVKNREEAESITFREKVWDWYCDDLYTRQEPGAAIVLTMTRWHDDDLAGRILRSEDGPNWTVIKLPAIALEGDPLGRQPGAPLCPDRFSLAELEDRRRTLHSSFEPLYQQNPVPEEGGRFKRHWFRYWEPAGDGVWRLFLKDGTAKVVQVRDCHIFATADSANSVKTAADYTVFSIWAVTKDRDLLLLHRERDRFDDPTAVRLAVEVQRRWKPAYWVVESNAVGLPRIAHMRKAGLAVREAFVHKDKISRSLTAVVRCEAGQIFWPLSSGANPIPWLDTWELEHTMFPSGEHDDQVDTTSLAALDVFGGSGAAERGETIKPERRDIMQQPSQWERTGRRTPIG